MKRTWLALSVVSVSAVAAAVGAAACSSNNHGPASSNEDAGSDAARGGNFMPEIACNDSIDSIYADPGDVSARAKGDILKCAHDKDVAKADLQAQASASDPDAGDIGYGGKPFTSGARVYRILYRTERGDDAKTPGYSSALVLLPDTPRATQSPVVALSHGSRGQAGKCAPSKLDPAASDVNPDFIHQAYPLVGQGFAVIAPDLAGYANYGGSGNPPSAYASAADVGKSTLDAARALRNVIPGSVSDKAVLVGHSQGGHTALSALALAGSYGAGVNVAAVAVFAPLWWTQRAWAALFLEPSQYGFAKSSGGKVSIWYHYTHSELLDGPGHGTDLFQASKQAGIKAFVNGDCWSADYPDLDQLGQSANDVFDSTYVGIMKTAALNDDCKGDARCTKMLARMQADWPHLQGGAAKVPILVLYAKDDQTITPDLAQCVFDRLSADGANYRLCYDTRPIGHGGVVSQRADYVADWIAQQTLSNAGAPGDCPNLSPDGGEPQLVDEGGAPIPCNALLPQN